MLGLHFKINEVWSRKCLLSLCWSSELQVFDNTYVENPLAYITVQLSYIATAKSSILGEMPSDIQHNLCNCLWDQWKHDLYLRLKSQMQDWKSMHFPSSGPDGVQNPKNLLNSFKSCCFTDLPSRLWFLTFPFVFCLHLSVFYMPFIDSPWTYRQGFCKEREEENYNDFNVYWNIQKEWLHLSENGLGLNSETLLDAWMYNLIWYFDDGDGEGCWAEIWWLLRPWHKFI